jgi:hypothetical protein
MKVHWSSTFVMLTRAESRRKVILISLHKLFLPVVQAVDEFVYELGYKETNLEKRRKIATLTLNEGEWTRVRLFCNLLQVSPLRYINSEANNMVWASLQHADDAQGAFSSASMLTLHNALPTLERLHAAWEKASSKPRYLHFARALNAGMDKLNSYYQRSAESDAHIMAMG